MRLRRWDVKPTVIYITYTLKHTHTHTQLQECIDPWLSSRDTCPLRRCPLVPPQMRHLQVQHLRAERGGNAVVPQLGYYNALAAALQSLQAGVSARLQGMTGGG
jgi:hypothetical protein